MKKFWKWAVILMTATMAAGMAASCEEKDNEEPVTIRKTWLVFDEGEYVGYDLGSINGKLCLIETFVTNEEDAEKYSQMFEVEISVNDILYVDSKQMTIEYKNLTKDSVTLIPYEDGAALIDEAKECRTPAGWGLTVNNYVDVTSAIQ